MSVSLTDLAAAARVIRDAVRDKSYQGTPLGLKVAEYLVWKQAEDGALPRTIRDYEASLARLAIEHADLGVHDFEPPEGVRLVRAFWMLNWGDQEASTRRKVLAQMRDFFRWLVRDDGSLDRDPTSYIRTPRRREPERGKFFTDSEVSAILTRTTGRDRVATRILFDLAVRKTALRLFRLGDYDPAASVAAFHWKGARTHVLPVPFALRGTLDEHIALRAAQTDDWPREYLLFPQHFGPGLRGPQRDPDTSDRRLLWEDRYSPLSETAMHNWWVRLLASLGLEHRRLHNARHTSLTRFQRAHGDLKLTQLLAGHKSITTTADLYAHLDVGDLAAAFQRDDQED